MMQKSGCQLVNSNGILIKLSLLYLVQKRQRDKLKTCFLIDILGSPLCPAESAKNLHVWFDSEFSCPNLFRISAKVFLCHSVTLDMSGFFLLMMLLYLWPMLLLVVGLTILTRFSGVSLSSIFVNYSASKIVQLELP